jgi:hypothetical protein
LSFSSLVVLTKIALGGDIVIRSLTQLALLVVLISTLGASTFAQLTTPGGGKAPAPGKAVPPEKTPAKSPAAGKAPAHGSEPQSVAVDLHDLAKKLPAGTKPYDKHGELLQVTLPDSAPQTARLFAALDPFALVTLQTGEIKPIHRSEAKPTTSPFVPA